MEGNMKKYRKDDTLNKKHKWAMLEAKTLQKMQND